VSTANLIQADARCKSRPPAATEKRGGAPWVVRVPAGFFDARISRLGHRKGWMILVLEAYCRSRCYCWAGNAELADTFGCSVSAIQGLLAELERDGRIRRVLSTSGRAGRTGIILLERGDPDLPVATAAEVPDVARDMAAAIAHARSGTRFSGCSAPSFQGAASTLKTGPELRWGLPKEDEEESSSSEAASEAASGDDDERSRPGEGEGPGRSPASVEAAEAVDPGMAAEAVDPGMAAEAVDPGMAEVVEVARRVLGGPRAEAIRADIARVGRQVGGNWPCLIAAIHMAAVSRRPIARLLPWLRATALDFAANGISQEARDVMRRHASPPARAAGDARVPDAAATRAYLASLKAAPPPASAEDLEQLRRWASGADGAVLARLGQTALRMAGGQA
jgi:hypothetical protein